MINELIFVYYLIFFYLVWEDYLFREWVKDLGKLKKELDGESFKERMEIDLVELAADLEKIKIWNRIGD